MYLCVICSAFVDSSTCEYNHNFTAIYLFQLEAFAVENGESIFCTYYTYI